MRSRPVPGFYLRRVWGSSFSHTGNLRNVCGLALYLTLISAGCGLISIFIMPAVQAWAVDWWITGHSGRGKAACMVWTAAG